MKSSWENKKMAERSISEVVSEMPWQTDSPYMNAVLVHVWRRFPDAIEKTYANGIRFIADMEGLSPKLILFRGEDRVAVFATKPNVSPKVLGSRLLKLLPLIESPGQQPVINKKKKEVVSKTEPEIISDEILDYTPPEGGRKLVL